MPLFGKKKKDKDKDKKKEGTRKPGDPKAPPQAGTTGVNVHVQGLQFDSGARFSDKNKPNIPPPPPGHMPNVAQQVAAQGHTVHMQQEKQGLWHDGGKGGTDVM